MQPWDHNCPRHAISVSTFTHGARWTKATLCKWTNRMLFSKFILLQYFSFLSSWRVTHIWETLKMSLHTEHQNRNIGKEIKRKRARKSVCVCVTSLKAEWLVAGAELWWKREALCEEAVRFSRRPSVATDTLLFPVVLRSSERPPKFNDGDQMTNKLLNKHFYRTQGNLPMNYDNFWKSNTIFNCSC